MKRALIGVGLAALLGIGLSLSVPGCGGNDYTPCEADIDCLIICDCANGRDAIIGPFPCRAGNCGLQHADRRDCFAGCSGPPFPGQDDDDSGPPPDDDDSGR
jgi:hypothetical protein